MKNRTIVAVMLMMVIAILPLSACLTPPTRDEALAAVQPEIAKAEATAIVEAAREEAATVVAQAAEQATAGSEIVSLGGECAVKTVDLLGAWTEAGAPESEAFDFSADDGTACTGAFEADILPLFTENNLWFEGAQACAGCHFGNTENSYHEMDLTRYAGIMAGGDVLSGPPGVPILGQSEVGATDFDWSHSKLRARLRNNRMAPGVEFDITEENRDGPLVLAGQPK